MRDLEELKPIPSLFDADVVLQAIKETNFSKAIEADLFDCTCLKDKDTKANHF